MQKVFLIEDDMIMSECIARAIQHASSQKLDIQTFSNGITAIQSLDSGLPDLICLDILLDGPDGFSFLNELSSYDDTSRIPVIIISSLDLHGQDLSHYNIQAILQKETMTPESIGECVERVLCHAK